MIDEICGFPPSNAEVPAYKTVTTKARHRLIRLDQVNLYEDCANHAIRTTGRRADRCHAGRSCIAPHYYREPNTGASPLRRPRNPEEEDQLDDHPVHGGISYRRCCR